jgi:hypothetical protein
MGKNNNRNNLQRAREMKEPSGEDDPGRRREQQRLREQRYTVLQIHVTLDHSVF